MKTLDSLDIVSPKVTTKQPYYDLRWGPNADLWWPNRSQSCTWNSGANHSPTSSAAPPDRLDKLELPLVVSSPANKIIIFQYKNNTTIWLDENSYFNVSKNSSKQELEVSKGTNFLLTHILLRTCKTTPKIRSYCEYLIYYFFLL